MNKQQLIETFISNAGSPIIDRNTAIKLSGGLIGSTKTLANLDSLKKGCTAQVRLGKRIGYETRPFAEWLFGRINDK